MQTLPTYARPQVTSTDTGTGQDPVQDPEQGTQTEEETPPPPCDNDMTVLQAAECAALTTIVSY